MKKVLYIQPLHPCGMNFLRGKYEVMVAGTEDHDALKSMVGGFHAIVTRLTVIDKSIIEAGDKLEVIAKHGVGVDNIDINAAMERNIKIVTTGDANSLSVAEHAFFTIGALSKRIAYLDRSVRRGQWGARDEPGSIDITGKKLGVVGIGRIGANIARMAKNGFNMEVVVYDPFASREDLKTQGYVLVDDLDELCRIVDFITLHVPLSDETQDLIDERRLQMMKPGAFLINFARGGIVNEDALFRALQEKWIAGAALDAFSIEPPDHTASLFELPNVILSPHCGTFSEDSRKRMSMRVAEGIDDILNEGGERR